MNVHRDERRSGRDFLFENAEVGSPAIDERSRCPAHEATSFARPDNCHGSSLTGLRLGLLRVDLVGQNIYSQAVSFDPLPHTRFHTLG